jgi:cytochrome c oxidase subunit 4
MMKKQISLQVTKVRTYFIVWVCLLVLTAMTVAAARLHLTGNAIFLALIIATIKSGLVVTFFMHLKDEPWVMKVMFLFVIFVLVATIVLTFSDVLFR